jgi:hypothetical protein
MSNIQNTQANKRKPAAALFDWRTPTTYLHRFGDSMCLLCDGVRPTDSMLTAWLDNTSEDLQGFAAAHGPVWSQGIVLIDAARLLADTPTEGVDHEYRNGD